MLKKNLLPTLLVLGMIFSGLLVFYGRVLQHPNTTMMGSSADAIKNYYTPWYHAKWDSTYTWFQGMNYPYGDHVVFADAQPLLSNAIKVSGLADYTVGIMNYAMLLSLLLAGWLLFRILLRWQVGNWWAAIAAACITLLSPQILKFNAHYGLAYAFAVPLVWHLALRALEKPSILSSLALTLTIFLLGWLHPYYVMISAVFLTAFWVMQSFVAWRETKFLHKVLHFSLQVILPVLLFTVALKLTDPVTDRPSNPYGFDQYIATWKSIFMPLTLVGFDKLLPANWGLDKINWEGIGYVGMIGGIVFLGYWMQTSLRLAAILALRKWGQFQWVPGTDLPAGTRKLITVSMLAGVAVGLFACGIPFAFKPELMTELFPPIKQFRSLGRFSWVFYYTWTCFSFYLVWRGMQWLKHRNYRWATWVVGGLVAGCMLVEGAALNKGVETRITEANPPFENPSNADVVLGLPVPSCVFLNRAHALMVLPYFHEGSENFHTPLPTNSRLAFQASIATGMPMLNVMMSRTSLSQTWSMMQLLTEPEGYLEILDHLPPKCTISVLRTGYSDTLDGPLVSRSGGKQFEEINMYGLRFDGMVDAYRDKPALPAITYPFSESIQTSRPEPGLIWRDFEDETGQGKRNGSVKGYGGGIGRDIFLKDNNFLHDGPVKFQAGDTVIVSLWIKMRGDRLPLTELGWEEWKGDQKVTWHYLSLNNSIQRLDGDWALCEREEVVRDPADRFQINVTRWKRLPPEVTIDKLMVRRKGTDVYGFENGKAVWLNNRHTAFVMPSPVLDSLPSGK